MNSVFWSLPSLFSGRVMLVMEPTLLPLENRLDQCSVIRFGNKKCWLPTGALRIGKYERIALELD